MANTRQLEEDLELIDEQLGEVNDAGDRAELERQRRRIQQQLRDAARDDDGGEDHERAAQREHERAMQMLKLQQQREKAQADREKRYETQQARRAKQREQRKGSRSRALHGSEANTPAALRSHVLLKEGKEKRIADGLQPRRRPSSCRSAALTSTYRLRSLSKR